MDSELDKILSESISPFVKMKYVNCKSTFLPETYLLIADEIENFEVRDDDIWVCSFPKAGTTWTQEMVWNIQNELNFESAKVPVDERFPFLEYMGTTTVSYVAIKNPLEVSNQKILLKRCCNKYIDSLPSPRFIKTHLPFHLLPRQLREGKKKNKIIYVTRNPKDVCVSYYHHYKLLEAYQGSFENFCKLFLNDKVHYAPFWKHVIGYWERKDDPNILFLKYEDMKADLRAAIKKTAHFLGKDFNDDQLNNLKNHLRFDNMKNNPSVNRDGLAEFINELKIFGQDYRAEGNFMRKGESGSWKTTMTKKMIDKFNHWTGDQLKDYPSLKNEFA